MPAPDAQENHLDGSPTYRAQMDEKWETILSMHPDAERPETSIVRYVDEHEFWATLAACVVEQGFPAEAIPGGGVRFGDIPTSQGKAQNVAIFARESRYPLLDKYHAGITEDQLRRLYAFHVEESAPCLERMGYEIEPPPSIQQYLSNVSTEEHWDPFRGPSESFTSYEESDEMYSACPQTPEGWWD